MSDYFQTRDRLRQTYGLTAKVAKESTVEKIGDAGFVTEIAGRVILTAKASHLTTVEQLPAELAERWEKASTANPFMTWVQGRYVEAEKANRNGAFWSTDDLQFGEMSVRHGPLNWLHEEKTIIGTIADNALINPKASAQAMHTVASSILGYDAALDLYGTTTNGITAEQLRQYSTTANSGGLLSAAMPRPYMAAVSAMWNWVHGDKVNAVVQASDQGKLWYSMECVGREMSCVSDETHQGCGKSFDYVKAMTQPESTCEHMRGRTSARRIVDPAFLGGAVIVPPSAPGWGSANAEVIRAAAALSEQAHTDAGDLSDEEWVHLMAHIVKLAT